MQFIAQVLTSPEVVEVEKHPTPSLELVNDPCPLNYDVGMT